ncbi:rubrerythrin [Caldanaerobacter subterraneus subsp. tengcongensis MB4]|jgi:rubrerythrin|uniref:Rubrerythrin diiron-binding domain-containing protein n=1 Tax=Caldanaerobacter subterraneus subsp. tengcongensis (strain DSM 15242 / JCM 11007 / NBRC 100824 / MB4) TaxID=273068 RepID=Q8R811_CALS4|nr:ferritin family protein [Caldanaerobacter subterraneus]AAM25378.1 conserved hypothetical protein [Caldanaerobacter subterraneus subsp. tengcongensis MB4]MCS3915016.1 rubrerythrin [Caldanaerobacter subterraneus subsp. tengcongensis MB4]
MNALEFAIKMEKDGEKFYTEQAEKHKGTHLEKLFLDLARDEKKHAEIIEKWAQKMDYQLERTDISEKYKNVFETGKEFKSDIRPVPTQLEVYELAMKKEIESIELYEKMLKDAVEEKEKKLFEFLIEEEQKHKELFDNLIGHLRKAEQWVESAEFGIRRDEY